METLWSPWRSKYIKSFNDEAKENGEKCFICLALKNPDRDKELLVVGRRKNCIAILNKFPYNNGHVLVAPNRHVSDLEELSAEEMTSMMLLVQETIAGLKQIYKPHGFNVGINLGRCAGAGLPGHLHIHVIPRWDGDTSFVSLISDIKVVSIGIEDTFEQLSQILSNK